MASAKKALIMLHGRGASADDILLLSAHFKLEDTAIFAPQATNNSWYPYSFMAPVTQNQPALDSALEVIKELSEEITRSGIPADQLYFAGFSQGACLTLEYVTRNARQYGGIAAFTGGLIGQALDMDHYRGDFRKTPVLITTGDPDPHVPVERVELSAGILKQMNADVQVSIFSGRPHIISPKEIELARELVFVAR